MAEKNGPGKDPEWCWLALDFQDFTKYLLSIPKCLMLDLYLRIFSVILEVQLIPACFSKAIPL